MKQLLCLVAIALLPFFSIAQIHLDKKNSINFAVGLAAGNRFVIGFDSLSQARGNDFTSKSEMLLNCQFGFDYQRLLTKAVSIKVGLRFARWGYKENYVNFGGNRDLRGVLQLEVPISVQYTWLNNKKFKPFVEAGVAAMLCFGPENGQEAVNTIGTIQTAPFAVAAQIGAGFSYQISDKFSFYAQVMGRIYISPHGSTQYHTRHYANAKPVYTPYHMVDYYYNIGAELGGRFHF